MKNKKQIEHIEHLGDNHISTSIDTPMLPTAFDKSDDEKIENIQGSFFMKGM